jgi:electron transfer flavoprotein alpha subunit
MNILICTAASDLRIKKTGFETATYAHRVNETAGGGNVTALVFGKASNIADLGKYGADKIIQVDNPNVEGLDNLVCSSVIAEVANEIGAELLVLSHDAFGKSVAGRLSIKLKAGLVTGVASLPSGLAPFTVEKSVFSGKAFGTFTIDSATKIVTLTGNSISPVESGSAIEAVPFVGAVPEMISVLREVNKLTGQVPLPEADSVVSGGRGMKGPENWGILEDLGRELGATMACSRPVSDSDWRSHHEHVGQTGIVVRPNLYIAVGISGAIQHLAGVNGSRVIVVINKDPEAPFFKAATYGVCADLFNVVPAFTEAIKKFKAQH